MNQLPLTQLIGLALVVMDNLRAASPEGDAGPDESMLVREMLPRELQTLTWSHHARQPLWWQHWQTMQGMAQLGDTFWLYRNPLDHSTGVALVQGGRIAEWIPLVTW